MRRQSDKFFQSIIISILLLALCVYAAFDIYFAIVYRNTPISEIPYIVYRLFLGWGR